MLLAAFVIALTLHLTAPSVEGAGCEDGVDPLIDLAAIRVYGTRRGTLEEPLLYEQDALRQEGQQITLNFSLPDHPSDIWTLRVVAVDDSGNESCGKYIGVNMTTDVPVEAPSTQMVWYDLQGRRFRNRPVSPGVYFEVSGNRSRKVVILGGSR